MNEVLISILEWYHKAQSPNSFRKYHSCPVCGSTWWDEGLFGHEQHNFDCWIPKAQSASKEIYMRVVNKGKAEPNFIIEE